MWLKICYVLKNNEDKLLGYIHVPTKQENFNEDIRWVQARKNGLAQGEKLDLVSQIEGEECSSRVDGKIVNYESGVGSSLHESHQHVSDADAIEHDLTELEISDIPCSPTSNEYPSPPSLGSDYPASPVSNGTDELPSPISNENFSVEIRYEPRGRNGSEKSDDISSTPTSPLYDLPEEDENVESANSEEGASRSYLEQISFNNKVRFIYSRKDNGDEDILSVPSRQEDFNKGISNFSSSPKRSKSLKKSSSARKLTSSRNDATYTVPTNSSDLKEMIYHQWLEKKKVRTKEEIKAKMLAQKKAAKQAEAEANERKTTARKVYDAWNESKTEKILSEKELKQKAKKAEKEKIEETLQRKKDAEKYFEAWKREKDEHIKKETMQKKKEEKKKDKANFRMKRQTSEEALKAFESWKTQKSKEIAAIKKKEQEEKAKAGEEKLLAFEKKQEALRVYEQWKEKTKKSPRPNSSTLIQSGRRRGSIAETALTRLSISSVVRSRKCEACTHAHKLTLNANVHNVNVYYHGRDEKKNSLVDEKKKNSLVDEKKKNFLDDKNNSGVGKGKNSVEKNENVEVNEGGEICSTTWKFSVCLLWRFSLFMLLLFFIEQMWERFMFMGVDPCLQMFVTCMTGFIQSMASLRNHTHSPISSCFHPLVYERWNCTLPTS